MDATSNEVVKTEFAMRDIVVIGGSAGAIEVLRQMIAQLPADLPASVFVVTHLGSEVPSSLAPLLGRHSELPVVQAQDNEPFEPRRVYVAPPDLHLTFVDSKLRVQRGPKENRHRPSVDTLFRSAAKRFGNRVIGVVLSGLLDDGAAGLQMIRRAGGVAVVQSPETALFPSMPKNAIEAGGADHIVAADEIASLLKELVMSSNGDREKPHRLDDLDVEPKKTGHPSEFTCPECHGTLWEEKSPDGQTFECRTGHRFSLQSLMEEHDEALENALWVALRNLEENVAVCERLAKRTEAHGFSRSARSYHNLAENKRMHANTLRTILTRELPKTTAE